MLKCLKICLNFVYIDFSSKVEKKKIMIYILLDERMTFINAVVEIN